jgi:hypothetical protein
MMVRPWEANGETGLHLGRFYCLTGLMRGGDKKFIVQGGNLP